MALSISSAGRLRKAIAILLAYSATNAAPPSALFQIAVSPLNRFDLLELPCFLGGKKQGASKAPCSTCVYRHEF